MLGWKCDGSQDRDEITQGRRHTPEDRSQETDKQRVIGGTDAKDQKEGHCVVLEKSSKMKAERFLVDLAT